MKEFIDKLIGRLEERKGTYFDGVTCEGTMIRINDAISIVNELAEEMGVAKNAITTWIPCSERLPESGGVYIVTIEGAKKTTTLTLNIDGWADEFDNLYKVIAWMPMPPAYVPKGE